MFRPLLVLVAAFSLLLPASLPSQTSNSALASPVAAGAFQRTWERTDRPVAELRVQRTWMWGPAPLTGLIEEQYAEASGGERTVQYYDKARMELPDPNADPSTAWFVTNGLIARELITGQMQIGDHRFEPRNPATINVAGDQHDRSAPTYASFANHLNTPAHADFAPIIERITRDGSVQVDPSLAGWGATYGMRVALGDGGIERQIASPFWAFMTSHGPVYEDGTLVSAALFEDPFYATGLPLTEPYWTQVQIAGQPQDVLLQCFERRCLTWTPNNPDGFQTESANVGAHYANWRYGEQPPAPPTPPITSPPDDPGCGPASGSSITVRDAESLQSALDDARPGSTIRLADGTYRDTFHITRSGRADAPITLCGGPNAVLQGDTVEEGTGIRLDADHWVIEGFSLRTYLKGVETHGSTGVTIRGLNIANTGQEAIHLRTSSSANIVEWNTIRDTGRSRAVWGEGIYIGSDSGQWCDAGNCSGDASNDNVVQFNTIGPGVTAELIEVKEGTSGGTIRGNTLIGDSNAAASGVDALIAIKGNHWLIVGNTGTNAPEHGMRVNTDDLDGWGTGNRFVDNVLDVQSGGYGFRVPLDANGQPLPNQVACANNVSNAGSGFANIPCTP